MDGKARPALVANADGSGAKIIVREPGWNTGEVWSPDGTPIAFNRPEGPARTMYPDVRRQVLRLLAEIDPAR